MSGSVMKCPKCGQPRSNPKSCTACGIIFEKYAAKQRKIEEMEYLAQEEMEEKRSRRVKQAGIAIAVAGVLGVAYVMHSPGKGEPAEQPVSRVTDFSNPYNPYNEFETKKLLSDDVKKKMAAATFSVTNKTLKYPRNKGTALVITNHCQAITGYEISLARSTAGGSSSADSLKSQIASYEDAIEKKRDAFNASCVDCSDERFEKSVAREMKNLEEVTRKYNTALDKMVQTFGHEETLSASINQTQQVARVDDRNEPLGLSLLYVENTDNCHPAVIGDSGDVQVGDKVFMMGGNGRVTNGEVTGFTTSTGGYRMIMHSASASTIDGLAGAPLFNEKGELLGINVPSFGTDRNAITIQEVLGAFNLVL